SCRQTSKEMLPPYYLFHLCFHDLTRLKVNKDGFADGLPFAKCCHSCLMVAASTNVSVSACMWSSVFGLMPQLLSKSKYSVMRSDPFRNMPGWLARMQ